MNKYIILVLIATLLLVWFINDEPMHLEKESTVKSQSQSNSIGYSSSTSQSIPSQLNPTSSQHQAMQHESVSSVDKQVMKKNWRQSRGIFDDGELVDYEGFKLDKLEELANKGDLKAIEVLSKYELSSGNTKRLLELMDLGAVHGSLNSLRYIGAEKKLKYMNSRKEEDALEAFAYLEFQAKRGDLFIKDKIPVDYKILNFYPTQEQASYIDQRSDELMADFEKRRKEMGLPPFDNSTLESDRELFDDD